MKRWRGEIPNKRSPRVHEINDATQLMDQTRVMMETLSNLTAADVARARVPGLLRRLATMVYDLMLLCGVLVFAAAVFVIPAQSVTGDTMIEGPLRLVLQGWLLAVVLLYFGYFWSEGRQTLAMRAWRTRLVSDDGAALSGMDALRRLVFAVATLTPLGAGLLWVLFDRDGLAWYDRLSRTRPVIVVKPKR
ncbi:MAG: RDD family protein [Thiohalocapsa sp.]